MIINHPTALYKSILPNKSGGNITYTISNNDPPRSNQRPRTIPPAIELKTNDSIKMADYEYRKLLGDLVFTISKSSSSVIGSAKKSFEVGQILEFTDQTDELVVDPMLASNKTEIQHNTNILDFESLGLSDSQIEDIKKESYYQYESLLYALDVLRTERAAIETLIIENKKKQNEANKAINALSEIASTNDVIGTSISILTNSRDALINEYNSLVTRANDIASESSVIQTQINKLSEVVR